MGSPQARRRTSTDEKERPTAYGILVLVMMNASDDSLLEALLER